LKKIDFEFWNEIDWPYSPVPGMTTKPLGTTSKGLGKRRWPSVREENSEFDRAGRQDCSAKWRLVPAEPKRDCVGRWSKSVSVTVDG
jgi:hypothetical protein